MRYKHNIEQLATSTFDMVLALNPVTFEYNNATGTTRFGLIAEEVELINPNLVSYDSEGLPQAVRYTDIIPLLIQAVKDLFAVLAGFAEKITTKELCLEEVCVTKEELSALLEAAAQQQPASPPPEPVEAEDPVAPEPAEETPPPEEEEVDEPVEGTTSDEPESEPAAEV